jgi:hypothetical protein
MAITWTLTELRSRIRYLTGKRSTGQLSDNDLDGFINDYYENRFPVEVQPERLKSSVTQATSVDDNGQYTLSNDIVTLLTDEENSPVTINGRRIKVYENRKNFFDQFPKDTGAAYCITDPTLAVGSTPQNVAYSAFSYRIEQYSYSADASAVGTALSGDTVPQNTYGAWRLEIDSDGTVSIEAAADNGTGYDTPAAAVEGIANESSTSAAMGYVTAMNTAAGGFVPGTTSLSASTVTETYTDGFNSTRARPDAMLYDRGILYLRPKPDDIYQFESQTITKPTALSAVSDTVAVIDWGPVVAYGTAIEIVLMRDKNYAAAKDLQSPYEYYKSLLTHRVIRQMYDRAPSTF